MNLCLWDTAGQERFHALGPIYYRGADAALLVFDITDVDSFTRIKAWVAELRQIVGLHLQESISLILRHQGKFFAILDSSLEGDLREREDNERESDTQPSMIESTCLHLETSLTVEQGVLLNSIEKTACQWLGSSLMPRYSCQI